MPAHRLSYVLPPSLPLGAFVLAMSLQLDAQVVLVAHGQPDNGATVYVADSSCAATLRELLDGPFAGGDSLAVVRVPAGASPARMAAAANAYLGDPRWGFNRLRVTAIAVGREGFCAWFRTADAPFIAALTTVVLGSDERPADVVPVRVPAARARVGRERLWLYDFMQAEERLVAAGARPRERYGFGLHYTRNWVAGADDHPALSFSAVAASYRRPLRDQRFALLFGGKFAFDRPDPEDELKSQAQAQFDFDSLLDGEDITVEVDAVFELKAYAGLSAQLEYAAPLGRKASAYARAGLGARGMFKFEVPVDTSITINIDDLLSGERGGLGLDDGGGGERDISLADLRGDDGEPVTFRGREVEQIVSIGPTGLVGVGLRAALGERLQLDAYYQLETDLTRPSNHGPVPLSTFGIGLNYRLMRTQRLKIPYVRTRKPVPRA